MAKSKPKIRIVHQLARTGGTLFSRILGSQELLILSEVHPSRKGRDIKKQLLKFYGMKFNSNLTGYQNIINEVLKRTEKKIIIRDLSNADFMAKNSTYKLVSTQSLDDFELIQFALLRNPINQYLSMMSHHKISKYMNPDLFVTGYLRYFKTIKELPILRYEDLVKKPSRALEFAAEKLHFTPDYDALESFSEFKKTTGDNSKSGSRGFGKDKIISLPNRPGYQETEELFLKYENFEHVYKSLKYNI